MQQELFSSTNPRQKLQEKYNNIYLQAYQKLNPEQKEAVDIIEGPVMVVAGPGTGKTQILAVRIGKILRDTDINPHNILCLTYTDAATLAMRKRLVEIIGPTAHQIHIFTFHSFCNNIIQENFGIFGNYRQLDLLSPIEEIEVYSEIIDKLHSDHILKNSKGNDKHEMKRLKNLFEFMKKENIDAAKIHSKVEDYLKRKKLDIHDKAFFYQRKYKEYQKGDAKPGAWVAIEYQMKQLTEASILSDQYQAIMNQRGRYDYQDMILWVLRAFQADDLLLQRYQERYQYVLVDEYQDTNGAQNALLEILINYWEEKPNAFVVGDDDQAIYKFQGANMNNIKDFKDRYSPATIVLKRNYRSCQPILDGAKRLISYNTERLVLDKRYGLDKDLVAVGPNKTLIKNPQIFTFQNETNENAFLSDYLEKAHRNRENLSKIGILYRQHAQVATLVEILEKRGVPLNIKRRVNILNNPLIHSILTILKYINIEHKRPNMGEDKLGELMYYSFFGIKSNDVARISLANRVQTGSDPDTNEKKDRFKMREIIADEQKLLAIGSTDIDKIIRLSNLLNGWISAISNTTLQVLFEKIINEGLILRTALRHADKSWLLQVLNTFFNLIKTETSQKPNFSLDDFITLIDTMSDNEIPLPVNKVIYAENGIHFITAHSSKGLEFEKVIIKGTTKNYWDKSNSNRFHYTYPDNLNEDTETNDEDERRLFFVAATRAKKELTISYAEKKDEGKILGASKFIDEFIGESDLKHMDKIVTEEQVTRILSDTLTHLNKKAEIIDHDLIDRRLLHFKLSVTGLNKYLKCATAYYFEDILRIPTSRNKYSGFGKAMHHALQYYYENIKEGKGVNIETLYRYFGESMKDHHAHFTPKEYRKMTEYGRSILSKYYNSNLIVEKRADTYELEIKIDHANYNGIPIKGVLDKVEITNKKAKVTDYKTGNYTNSNTRKKLKSPNDKNAEGGDYWRQIVFYKILSLSDTIHNLQMVSGTIDFVEPEKKTGDFFKKEYIISQDDIDTVGAQIEDTWKKIHNHEFEEGCKEEKCYWCNFVQNDFVFAPDLNVDEEDAVQDS
ncbi:MAG: ATP-dependent DNA helicase [Saprospiraceae bacterium]